MTEQGRWLADCSMNPMVQDDVREGIQMGFRGPPAIYINGRYIPRWSPELGENVLERILAEAAREQRESE